MTAAMDRAELEGLFRAAGAAGWGAVPYGDVLPHMDEAAREKAEALCSAPRWVLAAAFPYYAGDAPGNLSLYARGADYHEVVTARLERVCAALRQAFPDKTFVAGADNSPLPERECAWAAGLGLKGEHGLVILPPYGSYVFLGTILTDHDFGFPAAAPSEGCGSCGACKRACPGGALRETPFDPERCLSHLTQKKGELTGAQSALIARHGLVWGCDTCQRVCPHNAHPASTNIPEFVENYLTNLTPEAVEGATRRSFRETFPHRAFTWRGPAVIRRNFDLQDDGAPTDQ